MREVQGSISNFLQKNQYTAMVMPFSKIFLFVYPVYLLLAQFSFLTDFTNIIAVVSSILYFAYVLGLIMCVAKGEFQMISAAFAIRALVEIIALFTYSYDYMTGLYITRVIIGAIVDLAVYGGLAYLSFKEYCRK